MPTLTVVDCGVLWLVYRRKLRGETWPPDTDKCQIGRERGELFEV